ncbi:MULTISPECIES: hypothetical protein [Mycolicibacterium]|jgi:hypothetical protein|uniref:Uncharacterized protein n=1 Tax=Mycolicibacterium canariasense TaxID=228230 RepID=A0A124E254_MYCCR|nr:MULTISPECIES: hypothetical protein [Mycolicibacterium]MCC9184570.1 hypothetical protein [Mycolicibacterium mageritense]MCV7212733.1 hypothetical protein [Mycolicibacterium canariasense]ORV09765.1 hypothetical protein AWB94_08660 [Mycolicibacterium canariasense]GAS95705.1 uncharacterized protein RMCC_2671 [Mycolicibacterium canariasense]
MAAGKLHLDIPGASSDVADLEKDLAILQDEASQQLTSYQKLSGSVQGVGMDSATEFSQQQNAAINSVHDVVKQCTSTTNQAIAETIGYDQSIAGGKMTGA